MKLSRIFIVAIVFFTISACTTNKSIDSALSELKNFQTNTPYMLSSGLPTEYHFRKLKSEGVNKVIDLIPGDRTNESELLSKLDIEYYNIPVDWNNPKLVDFQQYVEKMQSSVGKDGKTLTHCRLNWRGAVFTYLYRVTQLGESMNIAKQDMLAIWKPNQTWQVFIDQVISHYQ